MELRTKRLLLRQPVAADVPALHEVFSDAETMQYWSKPPFTDPAQTMAFVTEVQGADPAQSVDFVVELNGRAIGKAGFWRLPEVGFILHRGFWGQGIATEALSALFDLAFGQLGLDKVIADVDPRNAGSLAVLGKLGFHETGRAEQTIEINGVWYDSIYLALPRSKWIGPPANG